MPARDDALHKPASFLIRNHTHTLPSLQLMAKNRPHLQTKMGSGRMI
jgi:hypothetical protein